MWLLELTFVLNHQSCSYSSVPKTFKLDKDLIEMRLNFNFIKLDIYLLDNIFKMNTS